MGSRYYAKKKPTPPSRIEDIKTTSVLYKMTKKIWRELLRETVLVVDPSCGSMSSMPGFSIWVQGELLRSGILPITAGLDLHLRLQELHEHIHVLRTTYKPSVLVYEDVPSVRFHGNGRTSSASQASLLKAVGVVMGTSGCAHALGLRPSVWKRLVRPEYIKSDERDAIEMGHIAISLAHLISSTQRKR